MKRLFVLLALLCAFFGISPVGADDKPLPTGPVAQVLVPAATTSSAAATASTPAPPSANKGDNAWVMFSAALVILMSLPGLALFYGGLVRSKNMLSVLMQVFVVFALITLLWVSYGYSLAFTEGG
ncbi:MAG TPA: ammonia channel protein, partial [Accumulibacter sp.]|nr:ammonia channel protein [Accumulibacter sp.]